MDKLGPRIKAILNVKGLDQKRLAIGTGISEQTVGNLLKSGIEKWKLSYFIDVCKFLHIHPSTFFDEWVKAANIINGNVDNTAILGTSNFLMGSSDSTSLIEKELRERIKDKEMIIDSLNEIIALQKTLLNSGISKDQTSEI